MLQCSGCGLVMLSFCLLLVGLWIVDGVVVACFFCVSLLFLLSLAVPRCRCVFFVVLFLLFVVAALYWGY